ncbi:MAG: sulfotransferase [Acidimicrobiia bacterium]
MEDGETLGLPFQGQQFTLPVYGYHEWWRNTDITDGYMYQRRTAKVLQSQRPPDLWLFKAPHHSFHLESLLAVYPGTKFVMTHRDPVKSVPSWASIVSTIFPQSAKPFDYERCGHEVSNRLRTGVEPRSSNAHRGRPLPRHLPPQWLVRDPMTVVRRVYDWLGYELTPEVEERLRTWQAANGSDKHGGHKYTPEQFGLTAAQLRSDYRFYTDHFGVELEVDA